MATGKLKEHTKFFVNNENRKSQFFSSDKLQGKYHCDTLHVHVHIWKHVVYCVTFFIIAVGSLFLSSSTRVWQGT